MAEITNKLLAILQLHTHHKGSQSLATLSPPLRHDKRAVWAHIKPVLEYVKSKHVRDTDTLHVISNGPITQYRNKTSCYLMSTVPFKMGFKHLSWNYLERPHGKEAPDGVAVQSNKWPTFT